MAIIMIYVADFTGGETLAEDVAKTLDYRSVSREIFAENIRSYGIAQRTLDEFLGRNPHWWNRWIQNLRPYRTAIEAAMCDVAVGGSFVYHGHLGHELLPGIRHVLRVLLTAPTDFRVERCQEEQGLDEVAARRYIDHIDKARTRRLISLFGADWRDSTRFALAINTAQISLEAARQVIVEMARFKETQLTGAFEEEFQNLILTTRVQAALTMSSKWQKFQIDVRASRGRITVSGMVPQSAQQEIVDQVKRVRGVAEVVQDFVTLPERRNSDYDA